MQKKLDDFVVDKGNEKAWRFIQRQINKLDEKIPDSMMLHGDPGTGKTWLMAELWKAVRRWEKESGHNILTKMLWFQATDFVSRIREEIEVSKAKNIRYVCKECDILFIDDLGTEHTTDWVLDSMISVIDHRYRELKTTCITTNKDSKELSARYGDAFLSRIADMCEVLELSGKDRRINSEDK